MKRTMVVLVAMLMAGCGGNDCTPGMRCEAGAVVTCTVDGDEHATQCANGCVYVSSVNPQTGTVHSVPMCLEVAP